ncbi:MAG TPA: lipoate--protein ligase family protein [Ignavibacteriaceae bacterium]|nr:lipoate--protein ligase family protein [Ignavibacteriaceae bacterium]
MIWRFINTGFNPGSFNMDYDLELVRNFSGAPVLRVYQWKPYCISLGANQDYNSVDQKKTAGNGLDVVKRPTGGRAILHAEELTYSVVYPISDDKSPKQIYREINLALKKGLVLYDYLLDKIELEHTQPHFPTFYKDTKSTLCFAVSAMNELNYKGKKVVGSAQRKIGNVILQHGSILCGSFHKRIIDYLNLPDDKLKEIKTEIERTTIELEAILDEEINYQKLSDAIKEGFENHFNVKLEEEIFTETISQVN